jgi:hypothetical protein
MKFLKKKQNYTKKIEKLLGLNLTLMNEIEKNKSIKKPCKTKKKIAIKRIETKSDIKIK